MYSQTHKTVGILGKDLPWKRPDRVSRSLLEAIKKRKLAYFGVDTRYEEDSLEKDITMGIYQEYGQEADRRHHG